MKTVRFTFWQDEEFFLGYLNEYPDYLTQAYSKAELMKNLLDLSSDLTSMMISPKNSAMNNRFEERT